MQQYKQRRRRSMAAWADTWRTEMKCAFPGPRQLRIAVLVGATEAENLGAVCIGVITQISGRRAHRGLYVKELVSL